MKTKVLVVLGTDNTREVEVEDPMVSVLIIGDQAFLNARIFTHLELSESVFSLYSSERVEEAQ